MIDLLIVAFVSIVAGVLTCMNPNWAPGAILGGAVFFTVYSILKEHRMRL